MYISKVAGRQTTLVSMRGQCTGTNISDDQLSDIENVDIAGDASNIGDLCRAQKGVDKVYVPYCRTTLSTYSIRSNS